MSSMLFAADETKSTAGQTGQTQQAGEALASDWRRQPGRAPDMGSLAMQRMLGRGMTISCCRVSCGGEEGEVVETFHFRLQTVKKKSTEENSNANSLHPARNRNGFFSKYI